MRKKTQFIIALTGLALFSASSVPAENINMMPAPYSISSVIQHVYDHNPGLIASRHELRALQERYPQALTGWRPSISAETSLYATDIESSNFTNGDGATTKDMSVNIEQPLYRSGRTTAATDEALNLIMAGRMRAAEIQQNVFLDALRAYADLKYNTDLLMLRRQSENIFKDQVTVAQERFNGGELTITDVMQAETRLADALANKIAAERSYENSLSEFERITGLYPDHTLQNISLNIDIPANGEDAYQIIDQKNPRLLSAVFRERAAQDGISVNLRELFPALFAFASYNKQYDPQPGIVEDTEVQTIGIRLSIPLYNAGLSRSLTRQARHEANQRRVEIIDMRRQVQSAYLQSLRRFHTTHSERLIRLEQIKTAEAAKTGVEEESRLGERTVVDVLDAEQDLIDTRENLLRVNRDIIVAEAEIASHLGILTPDLFQIADTKYDPDIHLENIKNAYFRTTVNHETE